MDPVPFRIASTGLRPCSDGLQSIAVLSPLIGDNGIRALISDIAAIYHHSAGAIPGRTVEFGRPTRGRRESTGVDGISSVNERRYVQQRFGGRNDLELPSGCGWTVAAAVLCRATDCSRKDSKTLSWAPTVGSSRPLPW